MEKKREVIFSFVFPYLPIDTVCKIPLISKGFSLLCQTFKGCNPYNLVPCNDYLNVCKTNDTNISLYVLNALKVFPSLSRVIVNCSILKKVPKEYFINKFLHITNVTIRDDLFVLHQYDSRIIQLDIICDEPRIMYISNMTQLQIVRFYQKTPYEYSTYIVENDLSIQSPSINVTLLYSTNIMPPLKSLTETNNLYYPYDLTLSYAQTYYHNEKLIKAGSTFNQINYPRQITQLELIEVPNKVQLPHKLKKLITFPHTLTSLSISYSQRITSLSIPSVSVLQLRHLSRVKSISLPPTLTRLECIDMEELIYLRKLRKSVVQTVNVQCCRLLLSLLFPSTLKDLYVSDCLSLEELDLEETQLKRLFLSECPLISGVYLQPSLTELSINSCSTLKEVDCSGCKILPTISIQNCKLLESLELPLTLINLSLDCRDELKQMGSLQHINLKSVELLCHSSLNHISFSSTVTSLTLKKLNGLFEAVSIKQLTICDSPISTITLPTTVSYLQLINCSNLTSIQNSNELQLRHVRISKCYQLNELSLPTHVLNLTIGECNVLSVIKDLKNIQLEYLELVKCNKLGSLDLPRSLKYLKLNESNVVKLINLPETQVKRIDILKCSSLKTFALPQTTTKLVMVNSKCKTFPQIKDLPIQKIYLSECLSIKGLSLPTSLKSLTVIKCRNISINNLTELKLLPKEDSFFKLRNKKDYIY
ncbi:hypothetical protein QTN25_007244 [Entamoeba marina]